jgi:hypothetical protein
MELRIDATPLADWLRARGLTADHIEAVRELGQNFATLMVERLATRGDADYSYLAAAIANDWEAQMLLATAGYPLQAMALVRGSCEKLAFLKLFMTDPEEAAREHERLKDPAAAPLHSYRLIAKAFGEHYYTDVFKPLHEFTHADLRPLRAFQLRQEPGRADQGNFLVGPSYEAAFAWATPRVLQFGAILAWNALLHLEPPRERAGHLLEKTVELIDALRANGWELSPEDEKMLEKLRRRFTEYRRV